MQDLMHEMLCVVVLMIQAGPKQQQGLTEAHSSSTHHQGVPFLPLSSASCWAILTGPVQINA